MLRFPWQRSYIPQHIYNACPYILIIGFFMKSSTEGSKGTATFTLDDVSISFLFALVAFIFICIVIVTVYLSSILRPKQHSCPRLKCDEYDFQMSQNSVAPFTILLSHFSCASRFSFLLFSKPLLSDHYSAPYSITGMMIVLYNLAFQLRRHSLVTRDSDVSIHVFHVAFTLALTTFSDQATPFRVNPDS